MTLTPKERDAIVQRACGSYSGIPVIRQIVSAHKKNRAPEDQPFLDFARLVIKPVFTWDDYERLGRVVLALVPDPFGIEMLAKEQPKKKRDAPRKEDNRNDPPPKESPAAGLLRLFDVVGD